MITHISWWSLWEENVILYRKKKKKVSSTYQIQQMNHITVSPYLLQSLSSLFRWLKQHQPSSFIIPASETSPRPLNWMDLCLTDTVASLKQNLLSDEFQSRHLYFLVENSSETLNY